ncbi:MAG: phosphonate utilization associated putative rane protein [Rhizobiaceae bacterium]|nr:phosphonate utilization associated putative rane protein [Rhizobiaceae bacterium]
METWIPITIAAAFVQNLRSAAQKHLKGVMGTTGATFVRFGFGLPFALLFVVGLRFLALYPLPLPNAAFFGWSMLGGLAQILATFLLIHLAQAALFGLMFLGERASPGALVAICISVVGVMLISVAHTELSLRNLIVSTLSRNALIGLASGTAFGVAAVAYRAASLALGGPNFMMQAAVTLAFVITMQTLIMLLWMVARERAEIARIAKAWKVSLFTGLAGASASFGWFAAMTLEQAAVVKSLAQIEMIFTFAASAYFFKERISRLEVLGCLLIVGGILVLLAVG